MSQWIAQNPYAAQGIPPANEIKPKESVMSIEELREKLIKAFNGPGDKELTHMDADDLLLEYINDPEVTRIFNEADKWYA
jgi:hypothetical protein